MLFALALACADPPQDLPTADAAATSLDREAQPPLYRKLYDYAFLPKVQYDEQRVRLRIWLHYMDFNAYQLGLLDELVARQKREFAQVEEKQREIVQTHEPQVDAVYNGIWAAMDAGASEEELAKLADGLDTVHLREDELLDLRSRSVRTLLEAEQPFLSTLTPSQETRFTDSVFALRHRLDPYANPGDFNALVGTVYVAGDFGALTRTTFDPAEDHLNIGGLWSPEPEKLSGPYFQDARREVILYMLLLEPSLPESLAAERRVRAVPAVAPGVNPGPAPGAPPPGGVSGPGTPVAPTPGVPVPPTPVKAPDPVPAPAGSPTP